MSRVSLLGVPIDVLITTEAVERLHEMLPGPEPKHVATPNAEMLVESVRRPSFRAVLQATALNLPDSVGLQFAARLTGQHLPARVTGVDTVSALCLSLNAEHPVFFLGAEPGIAEQTADALQHLNPHLSVAGTVSGSPADEDADAICSAINASGAHVLLVAFGAPKQEEWIAKHLASMPNLRVAMGVGGTFDFLSGNVQRAPSILRSIGLEWAWRLALQPSRLGRILNAVVVFPLLVLRYGKNAPTER